MKPVLGLFRFDLYGKTGYIYCVVVLFVLFWIARRLVRSPFGLALRGIRAERAADAGARHAGEPPAGRDLHDRRGATPASPARC